MLRNFFRIFKNASTKDVQVDKVKKSPPPEIGEMASGNLRAAAEKISRMVDERNAAIKILAVQEGITNHTLVDYALKMALRLDCEVIALDVSDEPLQYEGDSRLRASNRFFERAALNMQLLQQKAESMGLRVHHVAQLGQPDEVIRALTEADHGIRYVLTKPNGEQPAASEQKAKIPRFNLVNSRR